MNNKTFKEEVIKEWVEKVGDGAWQYIGSPEDSKRIVMDGTFDLTELLDLYKKTILEALPQKMEQTKEESDTEWFFALAHNQCLLEVKKIIENI